MPAANALREVYPDTRIALLTLPYTAPLARLSREIDRGHGDTDTNRIRTLRGLLDPGTWTEYWRIARRLRAEHYDLAISVNGRMASLWTWLSGAARSLGYEGDSYPFMLSDPVPGGRYVERKHEVEYVDRLVHRAGAVKSLDGLAVRVPEDAERELSASAESPCGPGRSPRSDTRGVRKRQRETMALGILGPILG